MNLLDNYLQEVSFHLPKAQQEDILLELRELLQEQLDDWQEEQDEPLTQQQIFACLQDFGTPADVAAEYQPEQYLIGPKVFHLYWHTLKLAIIAVFAGHLLLTVGLGLAQGGSPVRVFSAFTSIFDWGVWVFAYVTLGFAAWQYFGAQKPFSGFWRAEKQLLQPKRAASKTDMLTNLLSEGFLLLWWNSANPLGWIPPQWIEGVSVNLSDMWLLLYWPINLALGAYFVLHLMTLVRGFWQKQSLLAEIALSGFSVVLVAALLFSGELSTVTHSNPDTQAFLAKAIENTLTITLLVIGFLSLFDGYQSARMYKEMVLGADVKS